MARTAKILLWLIVLPAAAGLFVTSIGVAEPYLSPSDLPVDPLLGVLTSFGILVTGVFTSSLLDNMAWRRMGETAGFTPDGLFTLHSNPPEGNGSVLAAPTLRGTVRGREVRARTYSAGGDRSEKTYTVVETDLETPVEWTALIAPAPDGEPPATHGRDDQWTVVDDTFAVWGSVSDEQASELLSGSTWYALSGLDSGVTVGNVGQQVLNEMSDAIPDGETAGQAMAEQFLEMAGAGEQAVSERVKHRESGLLLDPELLQNRAEAVVTVAEAVEWVANHGDTNSS